MSNEYNTIIKENAWEVAQEEARELLNNSIWKQAVGWGWGPFHRFWNMNSEEIETALAEEIYTNKLIKLGLDHEL